MRRLFKFDLKILPFLVLGKFSFSERQNCDAMSTASSIIEPNRSRGRTRHRSETGSIGGYSDYGLPPTHSQLSQRHRQGSVTSLLSNKSGQELVHGLEEFRARNQEELAKERLEAQVNNARAHCYA